MLLRTIVLLTFIIILSACGDGYYESDNVSISLRSSSSVKLDNFSLIDSYGESSATSNALSQLDPYRDGGAFEIYWRVDAFDNYSITFSINDVPSMLGSKTVFTQYCGYDESCYDDGLEFCRVTSNFQMQCDTSDGLFSHVSFYEFIYELPQKLYVMLEVCNSTNTVCEYGSVPVLIE